MARMIARSLPSRPSLTKMDDPLIRMQMDDCDDPIQMSSLRNPWHHRKFVLEYQENTMFQSIVKIILSVCEVL